MAVKKCDTVERKKLLKWILVNKKIFTLNYFDKNCYKYLQMQVLKQFKIHFAIPILIKLFFFYYYNNTDT